jgi:P-type Ca2+ transporter type 2C
VLGHAALITASTLVAFLWALNRPGIDAPTTAFMTLALAQVFHLGNARSSAAVIRPDAALANRFALGAVALCVALQLLAVYVPVLAQVLRVQPIGRQQWLVIIACSSVTAVVGQAIRARRTAPADDMDGNRGSGRSGAGGSGPV